MFDPSLFVKGKIRKLLTKIPGLDLTAHHVERIIAAVNADSIGEFYRSGRLPNEVVELLLNAYAYPDYCALVDEPIDVKYRDLDGNGRISCMEAIQQGYPLDRMIENLYGVFTV